MLTFFLFIIKNPQLNIHLTAAICSSAKCWAAALFKIHSRSGGTMTWTRIRQTAEGEKQSRAHTQRKNRNKTQRKAEGKRKRKNVKLKKDLTDALPLWENRKYKSETGKRQRTHALTVKVTRECFINVNNYLYLYNTLKRLYLMCFLFISSFMLPISWYGNIFNNNEMWFNIFKLCLFINTCSHFYKHNYAIYLFCLIRITIWTIP